MQQGLTAGGARGSGTCVLRAWKAGRLHRYPLLSLDKVRTLIKAQAWFLRPTAAKAESENLHVLTPPLPPRPCLPSIKGND